MCRFIFPAHPLDCTTKLFPANRIIASLFAIFGGLAFVLSAVGLYGVMSFSVSQRTQEFGIRMALGADAQRIFRMVMQQGAWQLVIGLALGAGGAALLLGVIVVRCVEKHSLQSQPAGSVHLFRGRWSADNCCRSFLFCSRARATCVDPIQALRTE